MLYTRQQLIEKLQKSGVFKNGYDLQNAVSAIGTYSVGCVVVACELLGLSLTGDDIDRLYAA